MSLLNSASLCVTPNAYKEGTLYSVIPNTSLGDMTVVRATTATRVNSAGLIELVPYNLVKYSEQFDNVAWTKYNCSISANATTSPDGTANADIIVEDSTASTQHRVKISVSSTNSIHTLSVFIKQGSGTRNAYIDIGNTYCYYNFSTGVITVIGGTAIAENYGGGWYRLIMTSSSAVTPSSVYIGLANGNNETYNGNGNSSIAFWGAQLVAGSVAKDYLRTETRLNIPRLDYSNGSCPSLLLEPQRTNFYTYSEQLDQWLTSGTITTTANYAISPSGIQNADRVQFGTSGSLIYRSGTGLSGSNTLSVWAKATSGTSSKFRFFANGNTLLSNDLEATNEWQRFEFIYTYSAQTAGLKGASTGASDVLFWGFQHEISSYATSYIPTTSAAVTRNADAISKTGISSLIGQTEGTLFVDSILTHSAATNQYLIQVSASASNRFFIYREGTTNKIGCYALIGATPIYTQLTASAITGTVKAAFAYQSGNFAFYVNGVQVGTSAATFTAPPSMGRLDIDQNIGVENGYYNYNSAILFPTRLTNAELASLTT